MNKEKQEKIFQHSVFTSFSPLWVSIKPGMTTETLTAARRNSTRYTFENLFMGCCHEIRCFSLVSSSLSCLSGMLIPVRRDEGFRNSRVSLVRVLGGGVGGWWSTSTSWAELETGEQRRSEAVLRRAPWCHAAAFVSLPGSVIS